MEIVETRLPELEYHGRQMSVQPLDLELRDVAWMLNVGTAVTVRLEPGDATRYELLLVPMAGPFIKIGNYSAEDTESGLIVTRFVGGTPEGTGIVLLNRLEAESSDEMIDVQFSEWVSNIWSMRLLNWWFCCLKIMMDYERTTRRP